MKYRIIDEESKINQMLDSSKIIKGLYKTDKYILFINIIEGRIIINKTSKGKGRTQINEFESEKDALKFLRKFNIEGVSTKEEDKLKTKSEDIKDERIDISYIDFELQENLDMDFIKNRYNKFGKNYRKKWGEIANKISDKPLIIDYEKDFDELSKEIHSELNNSYKVFIDKYYEKLTGKEKPLRKSLGMDEETNIDDMYSMMNIIMYSYEIATPHNVYAKISSLHFPNMSKDEVKEFLDNKFDHNYVEWNIREDSKTELYHLDAEIKKRY